jgi:hypothetical protein
MKKHMFQVDCKSLDEYEEICIEWRLLKLNVLKLHRDVLGDRNTVPERSVLLDALLSANHDVYKAIRENKDKPG